MSLKSLPVHMLWVSGEFSRLARLSLASFVSQGYRVVLWSYDPDHLRAEFAEVRDAASLLPMPREDAANMAYLTSLFRYRVLAELGAEQLTQRLLAKTRTKPPTRATSARAHV